MPQKKNPEVAELGRGKTGRVYGHLIGLLTVMKDLPLSYNRDLQEDKEGLFDTADTLLSSLEVFAGMLSTMQINKDRMLEALNKGYLLATDIADYLVKKGFKQKYPDRRDMLVKALDKASADPEYKTILSKQKLEATWRGPADCEQAVAESYQYCEKFKEFFKF